MLTRHRREEGAVAIMVALLLVVFMAAVALTVDVGGLYLRRRALVNGSDAAALSAAGRLFDPHPVRARDRPVHERTGAVLRAGDRVPPRVPGHDDRDRELGA